MTTEEEIRKQIDFCEELSKKLYARIRDRNANVRWRDSKRYRIFRWLIRLQLYQDIMKLRRELLILGGNDKIMAEK